MTDAQVDGGHTPLGRGVEFDIIRELAARWGDVARGLGDDAAIADVPSGQHLVVSTDSSVEFVHFRREWLRADEIGYRSATAALSDLAAMGAKPLGMTLALVLPRGWLGDVGPLADGIRAAAREANCPIIGGDLSRGDTLHCAFTVLGSSPRPVRRAGARPGDIVYVTGRLGGPGLTLRAFAGGGAATPEQHERFSHPVARIAPGIWLADHGATAMIDISDGLVSDAEHMAKASGVHLTIDLNVLPLIAGAESREAACSGEEYELLVTAPSFGTAEFSKAFGLPLTAIGAVGPASADGATVTFTNDGARVDLPQGYDHFSR